MHVKHFCVCMFYNAVFVYLYLYGLWPEIKSYYYYYYIIIIIIHYYYNLKNMNPKNSKKITDS